MKKFAVALTGLILITILSACSDSISPPKLSGPWLPGATSFELHKGDKWMQIRAWYPSKEESENKLLSSDEHTISAFSELIGLPEFLMGSEDVSRSNLEVETADGKFPVLIFNHGLMSYARQNMSQFEQLASNGYVVLSLANPGDSMVVVRGNGEVVIPGEDSVAYQALEKQKEDSEELAPQLQHDIAKIKTSKDFAEFSENMKVLAENPVFAPMSSIFNSVLENNLLLIDSLDAIQEGKIKTALAGHLDLNNIGAYGHSFGAIMSGLLGMGNPQVKAIVGMDAPQLNLGNINYKPLSIPACYVYADELNYADEIIKFNKINQPLLKQPGSCEALFKESAHYNFTDLNLVPPLRYSPMLGDVDNALMASNLETLLLSFFDTHLKQKNNMQRLSLQEVELTIY